MKHICIIITLSLFSFQALHAQTIKTKVLVIGGNAGGIGAAIQAAHSGVETLLIESGKQLGQGIGSIDTAAKIGLQGDFIKRYKNTHTLTTGTIDPALIPAVLKSWTDTVKNLKVMLSTGIKKIDKRGKGWKIRLTNGRKVKTELLIDATEASINASKISDGSTKTAIAQNPLDINKFYENTLYRTGVSAGGKDSNTHPVVPLASFLSATQENLLIVPAKLGNELSSTLTTGQAAGAMAAYCAFFNTTTKNINIRMTQGELLAYKSQLVPFADIAASDSSYMAIQHIGATGILKGLVRDEQLYFFPDSSVSLDDIQQPVREYYSRSQIWFANNKPDRLTLNDVLSLIKFSGNRGEELNKEVEKGWKTSFGFKGDFDLKKNITRRELAVLLDAYLKPFNVRVDQKGKLIY